MVLLSVSPGSILDIAYNSPNACISNYGYYSNQTYNEKQMEMMLKLMENVVIISQKLIDLMNKEKG